MYEYNYGWIPPVGRYYNDDIGFTRELIDKIKQQYTINSSRIYITGSSTGGFFSYSIGAYLPDEAAAIAPNAGAIGGRAYESKPFSYIPNPEKPISVLSFHGTLDPYDGNEYIVSVNTSISFWVEKNGCDPIPETNISESGKTIKRTYTNGENQIEVVLYTMASWGHGWPTIGGNSEISATDLIWEFFKARPKQHTYEN